MGYADQTYFANGKLKCYSNSSADVGKTVKVVGGTTTQTAVYDSNLSAEFMIPGRTKYTVSLISGETVQFSQDIIFNSGEYKELNVGLSKDSWLGVKNIISAGLEASMIAIGDTMPAASSSGETLKFIPIAIDHEATYGHSVLFGAKYCLKTARQMQTSNTNAGGYTSSLVSKYLDGDFYTGLNSELKEVISERTFQASIGSQSQTLQNETHKIWTPREYEIFGVTSGSAASEVSGGGAHQFPYFATSANRIKTLGEGGSTTAWWESSPYVSTSADFCSVDGSGGAHANASSGSFGLLPCFMISA